MLPAPIGGCAGCATDLAVENRRETATECLWGVVPSPAGRHNRPRWTRQESSLAQETNGSRLDGHFVDDFDILSLAVPHNIDLDSAGQRRRFGRSVRRGRWSECVWNQGRRQVYPFHNHGGRRLDLAVCSSGPITGNPCHQRPARFGWPVGRGAKLAGSRQFRARSGKRVGPRASFFPSRR